MEDLIMHLYVNEKCGHNCKLCCNKFYNIEEIPIPSIEELKKASTICLTGGDPFASPHISDFVKLIRKQYKGKKIYAYTSGIFLKLGLDIDFPMIDGITISPKTEEEFKKVIDDIWAYGEKYFRTGCVSNRFIVFKGFMKLLGDDETKILQDNNFEILGRTWDSTFKTPENEIFRRLPILI